MRPDSLAIYGLMNLKYLSYSDIVLNAISILTITGFCNRFPSSVVVTLQARNVVEELKPPPSGEIAILLPGKLSNDL